MLTLTLTVGISASGKTTWANEQCRKGNTININRDDLRFSLFGVNSWKDYKFTKQRESLISCLQETMAREVLDSGMHVIISDTNLNEKTRQRWKNFCKVFKCKYIEQIFNVDVEECQKRNAMRDGGIPPNVIYDQYKKFKEQYLTAKLYTSASDKPDAIICDIDGTLAHMQDRSPFDWSRVGDDTLDGEVADYLTMQHKQGTSIILLSGRDGVCRPETEKWLEDNAISYDKLYMREEGDCRKDTIVKEEMFDRAVRNNYNVLHVLDDRPVVCDMWRDLGLKVWSVADPRIKF